MDKLTALQHALTFLEELEAGDTSIGELRRRVRIWLPELQAAEKEAVLELELGGSDIAELHP
jgi:hypothetical protein